MSDRKYANIRSIRFPIYLANLLVSFHYFLVIYTTSTFLALYASTKEISFLYLLGSALSLYVFSIFGRAVRYFGNYRLAVALVALEMLALIGMAAGGSVGLVIPAFVLFVAISPVIYLNLDIFLEKSIQDEGTTGGIRGMFLTMQNITQVLCPLLAGFILVLNEYWKVYIASSAFLVAALLVLFFFLRSGNDVRYHPRTLGQSARYALQHPMLYRAIMAQFLLRFFYAWMVIYVPLYLIEQMGFSWAQIGVMFSIMLLPFLLLELPLGRFLDNRHSEKGMMLIGFVIMAGSVAAIPFITMPLFGVWTAVLVVSRIGASFTEVATESYFFKHVDAKLADTISLFRATRPATYIAAAVVAFLALQVLTFRWSFLVLAAVMLPGIWYALKLRSTR